MIKLDLESFIGTEHWYKHWTGLVTYTDGIKYLADEAKAYWLIDLVASYQLEHKDKPFQVWNLRVKGESGIVTMREDSDRPILVEQGIPYTDFPLVEIEFYCVDGVVMLKSEY